LENRICFSKSGFDKIFILCKCIKINKEIENTFFKFVCFKLHSDTFISFRTIKKERRKEKKEKEKERRGKKRME
jgi:hypothetical protein